MSRQGGFPVDDEDVIETVLRMLRAQGETQAATLLRTSRCHFEQTDYDNLDGGTRIYTLFVEVAAETFVSVKERHTEIEGLIGKALSAAVRQFNSGWYSVELAPLIVSMPGRPDLEGGPVTRVTRRAILDLIRNEGVIWYGNADDLAFLEPIFDLQTLPSADSRYKDAAGDIWQHRVNNEDWSDDWIFSDDRFALLDGPDVSFLRFVERLVAVDVRPNQSQRAAISERLNLELRRDGWSLVERETLAGDRRLRIEPWDPLYRHAEQALRTSAAVLSSNWMHQEVDRIQAAIDSGLNIHYHALDPLYWSTVDILDSILHGLRDPMLVSYHALLKSDLALVLRLQLPDVTALFHRYNYPGLEAASREPFLNELIALLERNASALPEYNAMMLKGVLQAGRGLSDLAFIEDNPPHELIDSFSTFYMTRVALFKHSTHILDMEPSIRDHFLETPLSSGGQPVTHYRFADSKAEAGIQVSDIVVGVLGKMYSYFTNTSPQDLVATRTQLTGVSLVNVEHLRDLIDASHERNIAFLNHVASQHDIEKFDLFLRFRDGAWARRES